MPCPHASRLGRLPGRQYATIARQLSDDFLSGRISPEEFLKQNSLAVPKSAEARFRIRTQGYALASLVIEHFWMYLQTQAKPIEQVLRQFAELHRGQSHTERAQGFAQYFNVLLQLLHNQYVEEHRANRSRGGARSLEHDWLVVYMTVGRVQHRKFKRLPMPSMADLVMMLARIAEVAPVVFLRDTGRPLLQQELFELLEHPSLLQLFVDIMMNDRSSTHPLITRLEGTKKLDLNNPHQSFSRDCFEICSCNDAFTLRIKPEIIERHRLHYLKAAKKRDKRQKLHPQVLGCPVLYTGKFADMHYWVIERFRQWYIDSA
ncbi:MAG: hypothetical protein WDN10_01270 [bacterium]